ncbi:MAG: hypothetical protein K2R93_18880 [Gemmatimonadaceae bacterium]|nr:hypothetical protein [Gemmatimonadaceae bacterium]
MEYHARHLAITVVGHLDLALALRLSRVLAAAHEYYRYTSALVNLQHVRCGSRSCRIVREAVANASANGCRVEIAATPTLRARIDAESDRIAQNARRRMGFSR